MKRLTSHSLLGFMGKSAHAPPAAISGDTAETSRTIETLEHAGLRALLRAPPIIPKGYLATAQPLNVLVF